MNGLVNVRGPFPSSPSPLSPWWVIIIVVAARAAHLIMVDVLQGFIIIVLAAGTAHFIMFIILKIGRLFDYTDSSFVERLVTDSWKSSQISFFLEYLVTVFYSSAGESSGC